MQGTIMTKRKDPPGYPGDEEVKKQFGEAIRKLRLEKGLSLEEMDTLVQEAKHVSPHPQWPRALGIVMRRLRQTKGLSRAQLSDASGLPLRIINNVERGKAKDINLTQLVRIAMALKHSAEAFVELVLDCESKLERD